MDYQEHIITPPQTFIDPSLTTYGANADARVVGILLNKLANINNENLLGGVDNKSIYIYTDPEKYGEDNQAGVLAVRGFYEAESGSYFKVQIDPETGEQTIVWDKLPSEADGKLIQLAKLLDIRNEDDAPVVDIDADEWNANPFFNSSFVVTELVDDVNVLEGDVKYLHQRMDSIEDKIEPDGASIDRNDNNNYQIVGFDTSSNYTAPVRKDGDGIEWVEDVFKVAVNIGDDVKDETEIDDDGFKKFSLEFSKDNFSFEDVEKATVKLSWANWG